MATPAWKETNINRFISISGPYGGSTTAVWAVLTALRFRGLTSSNQLYDWELSSLSNLSNLSKFLLCYHCKHILFEVLMNQFSISTSFPTSVPILCHREYGVDSIYPIIKLLPQIYQKGLQNIYSSFGSVYTLMPNEQVKLGQIRQIKIYSNGLNI